MPSSLGAALQRCLKPSDDAALDATNSWPDTRSSCDGAAYLHCRSHGANADHCLGDKRIEQAVASQPQSIANIIVFRAPPPLHRGMAVAAPYDAITITRRTEKHLKAKLRKRYCSEHPASLPVG
jgi:hypothetical protein